MPARVSTVALASLAALSLACRSLTTEHAPATPSSAAAATPSTGAESASSRRDLPFREVLPPAAREVLTRRMGPHGDRMILLVESVVLLNYDLAEALAAGIASEPKIGRPAAGEKGTLSALLPPTFFDFEDRLVERAAKVASAARAEEHVALTAAFTGLAETCVGCHAAYLYEPFDLFQAESDQEGPEEDSDYAEP